MIRIKIFPLPLFIWILILFNISSFFQSCRDQMSELPVISVEKIVRNEISLHDIADEINYIKLENSPLISKINGIVSADSMLLIHDANGVYKFNINGQFIGEIGRKGNGPKEYNRCDDIAIDIDNKLVFIKGYKTIYVHDFAGNYKKSFTTFGDVGFEKMVLNNHLLYFANGYDMNLSLPEYSWLLTNENGVIVSYKKNKIGTTKELIGAIHYQKSLLFDIGDNVFYWNALDDTILQVNNANGIPAFLFANDKYRLQKEELNADKFFNKTSWHLSSVLGTSQFLILHYVAMNDKKYVYTVFDLKTNTLHEISSINFDGEIDKVNTYDGGPLFAPKARIYLNNENWLINSIDAFQLIVLTNSDAFKNSTPKYPEKKKQLEQLANSLDENDNPVLMLVKLKE